MSPSPSPHLPGLDLLRALAIVWVMLYHYNGPGAPLPALFSHYGGMGVDLFFVLSGYLIGWQLLQPYTVGAQPRWRTFFARRAWRVLPAYLTVVALYFAVPAVREHGGIAPLWQFLTLTVNIDADYFHHRAFSHVWSLCVEEHFYVLLPALLIVFAARATPYRVATLAVGLLAGGMALRAWIWHSELAPLVGVVSGEHNFYQRYIETIYYPIYTRLDGLMAGVLLAVVKGFRPAWWARAMAHPWTLLAAGLALLGAAMLLFRDLFSMAGAIAGWPLLAIALAGIVAALASPHGWPGRVRVPGAQPLAAMAFSLYLVHKLAYHWVGLHYGDALAATPLFGFLVYNGAALAAGALLYCAVERPGLRLRDRVLAAPHRMSVSSGA